MTLRTSSWKYNQVGLGEADPCCLRGIYDTGDSNRFCLRESIGWREFNAGCLGEAHDIQWKKCAITSHCIVVHVHIATLHTKTAAGLVYSLQFLHEPRQSRWKNTRGQRRCCMHTALSTASVVTKTTQKLRPSHDFTVCQVNISGFSCPRFCVFL